MLKRIGDTAFEMLDGKITKLDEQSKEIVEERFNNKFGNGENLQEIGLWTIGISAAVLLGLKRMFDKKRKACKMLKKGPAKTACLKMAQISLVKKELGLLQKSLSNCSKQKNPAKCQMKVKNSIAKKQLKLKKAMNDLNAIKSKLVQKGKDKEFKIGVATGTF